MIRKYFQAVCVFLGSFNCIADRNGTVVSFTGCNARLEWNVVATASFFNTTSVIIKNPNGTDISFSDVKTCEVRDDQRIKCAVIKRDEQWFLSLLLILVTTENNGNYTAVIQRLLKIENDIKHLIVIDKPRIKETLKPILHKSFAVVCKTSDEANCLTYRWKRNGTYLNFTNPTSYLTFTNLTMIDKASELICHIEIENCGRMESNNCSLDILDSDPYTIQPYYGPYKVSLSLEDHDIYLQEHATFKVNCSAECYPICTFRWESLYMDIENETLVINNFDSKMTGAYTCIASNRETNVTGKSYPIFLHQAKAPEVVNGSPMQLLGMGLVIVAVSLVIVGVLFLVTHMHKYTSGKQGSQALHQSCAVQSNMELPQELIDFENRDRPLPIPEVQESACRRIRRPGYRNGYRKSISLHNLVNHTQNVWNPVQKGLSLETMFESSDRMETGARNRAICNDSVWKLRHPSNDSCSSMYMLDKRIRLEELYSKVRKDKKVNNDEQNIVARFPSLNNTRNGGLEQESQEDLYSTIDEAALSVHAVSRVDQHEETLPEDPRNKEAGRNTYDQAILPVL